MVQLLRHFCTNFATDKGDIYFVEVNFDGLYIM